MGLGIDDAINIAGTVGGWLGIGEGRQDRRQIDQQKKLQQIAIEGSKELTDYQKAAELQQWKDTNFKAQMEQLKMAGLNPAMLYGKGGSSGQLGGGGAAMGAASAADAAATQNAKTNQAMAIAQLQNIAAQTRKTEAETINLTEGATPNIQWQTELSKRLNNDVFIKNIQDEKEWATEQTKLNFEKDNANWEAMKAAGFNGMTYDDKNSPIAKAIKAGFEQTVKDLENTKTKGDIMKAEATIKQFEAMLTKQGIAAGSPWYVKIVADLLDKVGINLTSDTANTAKKAIK